MATIPEVWAFSLVPSETVFLWLYKPVLIQPLTDIWGFCFLLRYSHISNGKQQYLFVQRASFAHIMGHSWPFPFLLSVRAGTMCYPFSLSPLPIVLIGVVLGESPAGLLGSTAGQGRPLYLQLTNSGIKAQRGGSLIDSSSAMVQTGLELMARGLRGLVIRSFSDSHIDRGLQTVIEQYF